MSLRLRLIVAFFLFSVVPLAAVTFYSYVGSERALQVAAQHETEMLTGELTQRMQVVTTQISERVEHLMDMPVAGTSGKARSSNTKSSTAAVVARTTPTPAAPPAAPAPPTAPAPPVPAVAAVIDPRTIEGQVAASLGEVAMLLNNVEVRGLGRGGGRNGAPGAPQGTFLPGGRGLASFGVAAAEAALRAGTFSRPPGPSDRSGQPGGGRGDGRGAGENPQARADAPPSQFRGGTPPEGAGREGDGRRGRRFGGPRPDGSPTDPSAPGGERGPRPPGPPSPPGAPEPDLDPTHLRIDLAPIRRELFREMAPEGTFER